MNVGAAAADVTDSTDWLGTSLACLVPVEQAFRCHVCKDFYNSPMITSCNHTFCSLCIRRCLSVDGKCPLCRANDQESKLRGNWALREAIDAFCKARSTILAVAQKPRAVSPPKRKAEETAREESGEDSTGAPHAKRTRTSARLSKSRAAAAVATMAKEEDVIEIPESDAEGDQDYEPEEPEEPDDGLVACPICWMRMKPLLVDRHIDTSCPGSPQKAKAKKSTSTGGNHAWPTNPFSSLSTSSTLPPPERIPSLSYSLLTDTALRKKLSSLGLSSTGSRQLLERRHREWTTIWNANCDSARPKRKAELLHDLDVWERTVGSSIGSGNGGSGGGGMGGRGSVLTSRAVAAANQQVAQIRDKNFDGAQWSSRHSTSFKDLIANARKSRLKAEEKNIDSVEEETKPTAEEPAVAEMPNSTDKAVDDAVYNTEASTGQHLEHPELASETAVLERHDQL